MVAYRLQTQYSCLEHVLEVSNESHEYAPVRFSGVAFSIRLVRDTPERGFGMGITANEVAYSLIYQNDFSKK